MAARIRTMFVLAPLLLPLFTGLAQAQSVWTTTANSCTIDNSDLDEYESDSSSLQFRRLTKGTLVARCNLTNPRDDGGDPGWGTLEVVYRDPDGSDDENQVRVRVIRVNNGGNFTTVAELDSNSFLDAEDPVTQSVGFTHAFDFDHGSYYVELRVARDSIRSSNNPTIYLVRLKP